MHILDRHHVALLRIATAGKSHQLLCARLAASTRNGESSLSVLFFTFVRSQLSIATLPYPFLALLSTRAVVSTGNSSTVFSHHLLEHLG